MKIKYLVFVVSLTTLVWACGGQKENTKTAASDVLADGTYKIAPESSKVIWNASKVTGKHNGLIKIKSGSFDVTDGKIVAGAFTFDVNSITVTDIPAESEDNAKLVGHLKSADFFDAASFPEAKFHIISEVVIKPDSTLEVTGDLQIKGHTERISFPITITKQEGGAKITGTVKFDRTKFDIKYGSSTIGTLADKVIYDDVFLDLDLNAVLQPAAQ